MGLKLEWTNPLKKIRDDLWVEWELSEVFPIDHAVNS